MREDRLKPWLAGEIKDFLFDEFSSDYVSRTGLEFLRGVSMPLRPSDLTAFHSEGGLDVTRLADNMAQLLGADTHFRFNKAYLRYLAMYFSEDLIKVFLQNGGSRLQEEHYRKACIYYRAALMLDGSDKAAMFGYACCCREWYLSLEGEDEPELISILKEEATAYFEWCVMLFPDFAPALYYLGYAYLNAGQYAKADIIWKRFLVAAPQTDDDVREEIQERVAGLIDPVKIERGVNLLTVGQIEDGLRVLEPYTATDYNNWWPLHWYLASAYRELGYRDEAIEGYRKVLELSPSHIESADALAALYAEKGEAEMADKYLKKAELLRSNLNE